MPPRGRRAATASSQTGRSITTETTLWDLIDPELAGLAMASLYGREAPCRMRQMADACAEAGRLRDCAFWRAALDTSETDADDIESGSPDAAPPGAVLN
jgi:hypothetical protein